VRYEKLPYAEKRTNLPAGNMQNAGGERTEKWSEPNQQTEKKKPSEFPRREGRTGKKGKPLSQRRGSTDTKISRIPASADPERRNLEGLRMCVRKNIQADDLE